MKLKTIVLIILIHLLKPIYSIQTTDNLVTITTQTNELPIVGNDKLELITEKRQEAIDIIEDKEFIVNMDTLELARLLVHIDSLCNEYGVRYYYVMGIISTESRWNHKAKGPTNDLGLMQITPIAAEEVGMEHNYKQLDPFYNVETGIKLLSRLIGSVNNYNELLVAYNSGLGTLRKHGLTYLTDKYKYPIKVNKWKNHIKS